MFDKELEVADAGFPDGADLTSFSQGGLAHLGHMYAKNTLMDHSPEGKAFDGMYGWGGWGGSFSLVDPKRKTTAMYVMSGMGPKLLGDERSRDIWLAYAECMAALGK